MRSERQVAASRDNLAKYREKHPEGPRFRHGADSKHFRKRYTDGRTTEGRRLRATIEALRGDLGEITPAQEIILSRLREKLITVECMGAYLEKQLSAVTDAGELLPCLRSGYTTWAESLRRDIELLYTLAARRPARGPSLGDYMKGGGKKG